MTWIHSFLFLPTELRENKIWNGFGFIALLLRNGFCVQLIFRCDDYLKRTERIFVRFILFSVSKIVSNTFSFVHSSGENFSIFDSHEIKWMVFTNFQTFLLLAQVCAIKTFHRLCFVFFNFNTSSRSLYPLSSLTTIL